MHRGEYHQSPEMQQCIQNCTSCAQICLETISYCLRKGGQHAEADHIRLLLDCVEICQTCTNFMVRGSELHRLTCGVCSEICRRCAESCEQMKEDEQMIACAEACRRCADSCKRMAA